MQTCLPFNIYEQGTIGTTGLTDYPQTGHFDNALTPTFDINYGLCDYYFYQTSVLTNNNLYNLYWRRTVNQINVGKMLIAYFYLREDDIQTLKLNDKIRIDNSWWNINRVIDWLEGSQSEPYLMTKFHSDGKETLKNAFQSGQLEFKKIWELEG